MSSGGRRGYSINSSRKCGFGSAWSRSWATDHSFIEVYLASELSRNIISYGKLECKGFGLEYTGNSRILTRRSNGMVIFDIDMSRNVLNIHVVNTEKTFKSFKEVITAVFAKEAKSPKADTQSGTFYHFHQRLGHLLMTALKGWQRNQILELWQQVLQDPHVYQGNQTNNAQSRKDSGINSRG